MSEEDTTSENDEVILDLTTPSERQWLKKDKQSDIADGVDRSEILYEKRVSRRKQTEMVKDQFRNRLVSHLDFFVSKEGIYHWNDENLSALGEALFDFVESEIFEYRDQAFENIDDSLKGLERYDAVADSVVNSIITAFGTVHIREVLRLEPNHYAKIGENTEVYPREVQIAAEVSEIPPRVIAYELFVENQSEPEIQVELIVPRCGGNYQLSR
jgi:hypothetical protein